MARLKLRSLTLQKKPYGRFNFKVVLARHTKGGGTFYIETNADLIEGMRDLLRETCKGRYKLIHTINYKNRRVYTDLYLENAMDLAVLKLVHGDKLFKIYQIKVLDESI